MIKIENNNLSVLTDDKVQVLDFNATWCGPCKAMKPKMEALEKEMPEVEFADIDADENEDLFDSMCVKNVPTFIIRKLNKEERLTGAVGIDKIKEVIAKISEQ